MALLRGNTVKGKSFFFHFEYGLNHQVTNDNGVPIKSTGKAHWAQLDTMFPY